jgi:YidC/Oxa1 family membrane protein insertase
VDKRTVVALGIIALIFITLPYYWKVIGFSEEENGLDQPVDSVSVIDTSQVTEHEQAALTDSEAPATPTLDSLVQPQPADAYSIDTLPEEFTTIETELFVARISSRGAAISSFELKKFDSFTGDPMEMIPDRPDYPLRFEFPEADGLSSAEIKFEASQRDVSLIRSGADSTVVRFSGVTAGGAPVTVLYTFFRRSYQVGMQIEAGRSSELAQATRLNVMWQGGLDPSEEDRGADYGYFKGYVSQGGEVASFDGFDSGLLREGGAGSVSWVATKSKYFLVALRRTDDVAEDFEIRATERKLIELGQEVARREFTIQLGNRLTAQTSPRFAIYLGPVDYGVLSNIGHDLDRTVEMGFWLFRPFAVAILWFVSTIHKFVPNYGWVIILFTVVMKMVLFPFSRKNYIQMAKMKALQPKLKALQAKYKEEPQKLNQQMMKFYKVEKFNPLGGCIWMLPQLPIFWALFTVFRSSIDLRGAEFLWLTDLSLPSMALAVIMAAAMLVQQLLTNKDPKQRFMVYGLPIIMFFLFKGFPAGLVLYWTAYNILSIVEQKSVESKLNLAPATAAPLAADKPTKPESSPGGDPAPAKKNRKKQAKRPKK